MSPAGKSQRAHAWISEQITTGRFTPGYRLVLGTIADQLDMSVVPVREAVRRLEAEGLVTFERNVGARVTMVDPGDYRDSMETLAVLEGTATALSAPHLSEAQLGLARSINARMRALLTDFDAHRFTELNRDFHAALFETCPNARLVDLVRAEWVRLGQLRDSTFAFVPERAADSVDEHERLLDLIAAGADAERIEQLGRAHRMGTLNAYLEHDPQTHQNALTSVDLTEDAG